MCIKVNVELPKIFLKHRPKKIIKYPPKPVVKLKNYNF